jgi:hypothetical protein
VIQATSEQDAIVYFGTIITKNNKWVMILSKWGVTEAAKDWRPANQALKNSQNTLKWLMISLSSPV